MSGSNICIGVVRVAFFISGDSGAGYLNPTLLFPDPESGRRGESNITTSGAPDWIAWNTHWYEKFNLSFTGFLINGDAGPLTKESIAMYKSFSSSGVVVTTSHDDSVIGRLSNGYAHCDSGVPVMHHVIDLPANVTVRIYLNGRLAYENIDRTLRDQQFWQVAAVDGATGGASGSNAENTRALHVLLIEDNFDKTKLTKKTLIINIIDVIYRNLNMINVTHSINININSLVLLRIRATCYDHP